MPLAQAIELAAELKASDGPYVAHILKTLDAMPGPARKRVVGVLTRLFK